MFFLMHFLYGIFWRDDRDIPDGIMYAAWLTGIPYTYSIYFERPLLQQRVALPVWRHLWHTWCAIFPVQCGIGVLGSFHYIMVFSWQCVSRLEILKAVLLLCQMGGRKKYFGYSRQVCLKLWTGSLPSVLEGMQIELTFLSISWVVNFKLSHLQLEFRNLWCQRCWIYLVPFAFQ